MSQAKERNWTGTVARLIHLFGFLDAETALAPNIRPTAMMHKRKE